ncbi:MAG: hypothetical protein NT149_03290 [Candidatus Gottesmanbacteria bacterium]|nr:hypothetical protein [Candidatus Gottesmanbacteria bacterium]
MAGARQEKTHYLIHPKPDNIHFVFDVKYLVPDIINNEKAVNSIFAQAISAVNGYPQEKRHKDQHFQPYVFLTEPNRKGFLLGQIVGSWNSDFTVYSVDEIDIQDKYDNIRNRGIQDEIADLRHLGYPLVASESFMSAAENVTSLRQLFHQ